MGRQNKSITWHKTGNNQWTSNTETRNGVDYYATVDFTPPGSYLLTLQPDNTTDTLPTLGLAKNEFRKYLFDK